MDDLLNGMDPVVVRYVKWKPNFMRANPRVHEDGYYPYIPPLPPMLRACYFMSGTEVGLECYATCYAMSGTDELGGSST
eukprot:2949676-Rhodomonas_salina.3